MKKFLAAAVLLALLSPTGARAGFQVPDGGFEAPAIGANSFMYNVQGGPWTFSGDSGIINGSSMFGNTAPPEKSQVAFLQTNAGFGPNGNISQTLTIAAGTFSLSLLDEARAGYAAASYNILLDGIMIGSDSAASTTSFNAYTSGAFTVTVGGNHTLTFVSTGPTDSTTFLDNVTLNPLSVPEPASLVMLGLGLVASGTVFARKTRRDRI